MRAPVHAAWICCLALAGPAAAQESAGQGEIGYQQYILTIGRQRAMNVSGLGIRFDQFLPNAGLLSGSLAPALSEGRFRSGDDYLRLSGFPWRGHHWTFSGGDFRVPGRLFTLPFSNLYSPEMSGNGVWIEAAHGGRSAGFFYGVETVANSPRITLRLQAPQTMLGAYFKQRLGPRLETGVRLTRLSTDLDRLAEMPQFLTLGSRLRTAATLSFHSVYTIAGPLKWYGEAAVSGATANAGGAGGGSSLSTLFGPSFDTPRFSFRANYQRQSAAYLPLLGYYVGDRAGPFAEMKLLPARWIQIYASGSQYRNNLAGDPTLSTFQGANQSSGVSFRLPWRLTVDAQLSTLNLRSRPPGSAIWERSNNTQRLATFNKTWRRHNLRLLLRDIDQSGRLNSQRQRSAEVDDTVSFKRVLLGGGVRLQRLLSEQSVTSVYYRGMAQLNLGAVSAYANIESGSDLVNRTLFATNTISTTVFGGSARIGRNWEMQVEAFRNRLLSEINRESVFVLQGQGVFLPGALASLNQWSMYFRVSRRLSWGKARSGGGLNQFTMTKAPLKGAITGFVFDRGSDPPQLVEGVPVILDDSRVTTTDAAGRFLFEDVPEGDHRVALAMRELPADFDPGDVTSAAVPVRPDKVSRAEFDVFRLHTLRGSIKAPPETPLEAIVIRLLPGARYTTPDARGAFAFYNLRSGDYQVAIDARTLPEHSVLTGPGAAPASVRAGAEPPEVAFEFQIRPPEKPVRRIRLLE